MSDGRAGPAPMPGPERGAADGQYAGSLPRGAAPGGPRPADGVLEAERPTDPSSGRVLRRPTGDLAGAGSQGTPSTGGGPHTRSGSDAPDRHRRRGRAPTGPRWQRFALLGPPVLFLLFFFGHPLWSVLREAVGSDAWAWAAGPYVRARLAIAMQQAVLSVGLTLAIAVPLAWLHHARRIPFGRMQRAMHAAPFVLPVFVVVFGIQAVFGPRGWFTTSTGIDLFALGPMAAVVIAHAYYNYGFATRLLHSALERRPYRMEEAAAVLGAPPVVAFGRTTLLLLAPSILAVGLIVFFFAFTSFGVVLFLGGGEVSTLETMLFRQLGGVRPRLGRAAVLGIIQMAINVVVLAAYMALRRREGRLRREVGRRAPRAGPRTQALAWTLLGLGLLPALSVLVGGFRFDGQWTLEPWRSLIDAGHAQHENGFNLVQALDRSLFYAFWAATLSVALTLGLGYGLRDAKAWAKRPIEVIAALPLGTSSLLIGFGYFLAFGISAAGTMLDLRGTLWIIVLAHTLVAFPFTARAFLPALDQHERRLDEAAAVLGASAWQTVQRIHWPLLRAPLMAAVGLAIAMSLGDFGASLLLMDPDNIALSIWISRHDDAFDAFGHAQAVALSGLLMVMAASAYVLVEKAGGEW